MGKKNIEGKVADALLQSPMTVIVGKRKFVVPRVTLGTLTMVAEYIVAMPSFSPEKKIPEILEGCTRGREVARILAILLYGADAIRNPFRWKPFFLRKSVIKLENYLLLQLSPTQIYDAVTTILSNSELEDFFALTTFLRTVNLVGSEREVGETTKTTASGQ